MLRFESTMSPVGNDCRLQTDKIYVGFFYELYSWASFFPVHLQALYKNTKWQYEVETEYFISFYLYLADIQ